MDLEDPEQIQSYRPKVKQQDQDRVLQETREQPLKTIASQTLRPTSQLQFDYSKP